MTSLQSRSFIFLALFGMLLLISPSSYAQQWYHVEVLVFEQTGAASDEVAGENVVPSASYTPNSNNNDIQPAGLSTLKGAATRLRNSSQYQVLYHSAWKQPIHTKAKAKSVLIKNNNINGRVRFHKGTYLYGTLDVQLQQLQVGGRPYLKQTQRVRKDKVHFFDHSKLGVLLKLTPLS